MSYIMAIVFVMLSFVWRYKAHTYLFDYKDNVSGCFSTFISVTMLILALCCLL